MSTVIRVVTALISVTMMFVINWLDIVPTVASHIFSSRFAKVIIIMMMMVMVMMMMLIMMMMMIV